MDVLHTLMAEELKAEPNLNANLKRVADIFPYEKPLSIRVVSYNSQSKPALKESHITLRYQFPSKWVLAQIVFKKVDTGPLQIWGIHAQEIEAPDLESENLIPYLLAAAGVFAFVLFVLIWLVRRRR